MRRLEELGIGRPSTYAPTISTIINRDTSSSRTSREPNAATGVIRLEKGKISSKELSETTGREKAKLTLVSSVSIVEGGAHDVLLKDSASGGK